MNILVCGTQVPFVRGGAEALVDGLVDALKVRGHNVVVVKLPFSWQPKGDIFRTVLAWRLLDITESNGVRVDRVICTKFPSYAARHPHKVVWLVHQHRQAYDWYGTPFSDFLNTPEDRRVRRLVKSVDRRTLVESQRLFAISGNVADRLRRYTQLSSEVLYPPPANRHLRCGEAGDFLLYVGRLDRAKRVDLILEAARLAGGDLKYVIAGDGPQRRDLEARAARLGPAGRVEFTGYLSDEEVAGLYAGCRAVIYVPVDEDYGYTAVEALMCGKPVVTTTDSGGVLEFVRDGHNGFVVEPEPEALAGAIAAIAANRQLSGRLGQEGLAAVAGISWNHVVDQLTA